MANYVQSVLLEKISLYKLSDNTTALRNVFGFIAILPFLAINWLSEQLPDRTVILYWGDEEICE